MQIKEAYRDEIRDTIIGCLYVSPLNLFYQETVIKKKP